ncbi:MAG TPA: hypothetical protein VE967_19585 [Gemmatimonadaceae bacterium]|nr:hypothetical protein [Gemmatimonadaceae bacterium]
MRQLDIDTFVAWKDAPAWAPWRRVHKGDVRCRVLADKHYTRQSPGHPMWTRPGYNFVLYANDLVGDAVFCWWRPKWEAGQERKDRLHVIECTIFRREQLPWVASDLIRAAVAALDTPEAAADLRYASMGLIDCLITGVGSKATARLRGKRSLPGHCFRRAGWRELAKRGGRADVWLWYPAPAALSFRCPAPECNEQGEPR